MNQLFDVFDSNDDGVVDLPELISGLSILCRGSRDQKVWMMGIGILIIRNSILCHLKNLLILYDFFLFFFFQFLSYLLQKSKCFSLFITKCIDYLLLSLFFYEL